MAAKKDFSQRALSIVEQVTGDGPLIDTPEKQQAQAVKLPAKQENAAATAGRLGGLKGGVARAKVLTAAERSTASRKAALVRWEKKNA